MKDEHGEATRLRALKAETQNLVRPWVSEIVLQTNQYDRMKLWYEAVLGGDWLLENTPDHTLAELPSGSTEPGGPPRKQVHAKDVRAAFMRLPTVDPYGLTFALFELPWLTTAPTIDPGINHMQLKHLDLEALVRRVELLRDAGIDPHRSADHGPMTSFYFADPDLNVIELCVDNFSTPAEMNAIIQSASFKANPSGIDFDRDDFVSRFRRGMPREELVTD